MTPTLDDLVEIDVELGPPREHVGGGRFYHHGPVLVTPPGDSPTAGNISAHELSHFWLHSSTPYGLVLDELGELQQVAALEYCGRLHSAGHAIPIAAHEVARRALSDEIDPTHTHQALLRELVDEYVLPWSQYAFLERWLEGANSRSVRATRLGRTLRWLVDFEERSRALRPDETLFAGQVPEFADYQLNFVRWWGEALDENQSLSPPYPTLTGPDGEQQPLGGRHLFEAHAQMSEVIDGPFWETASDDARELYWGLLAALVGRFPGKVDDEDSYVSLITMFIVVVELALMIPVGRVYGRLRHDQMRWFALHPGWRCSGLINGIRDDDWPMEEPGAAVPELLRSLSLRNGWPRPAEFLELGASLAPVTPRIARHAAACRLRLEEPDLLVVRRAMPDRVPQEYLTEHGPIIIRGSRSYVPGEGVNDRVSRLLSFSFASMTAMVMQRGTVDLHGLFPPNLDFTNIFDNIASREDLLAEFDEVLPFLADDAFCPAEALDRPA